MSAILSVFSNRELAFLIWLVILLVYFLIKNRWRYHLKRIIISAFTLKLVVIYTTLAIYASIIVILLYLLNIWGIFLLKDTVVSQQFLLPLILTILFIPYYWGLTLYMNYEIMFVAINVIFRDKDKYEKCKIKFYILYYGHLNLKRINRIKHKIAFLAYQDAANYKDYFKKAAQAPLYTKSSITNKMKIKLFNNIGGCCKALSDLQLDEFSEWKKLDGLNEFYSITNYYLIKKDGLSNLVLSLQGEELYIHKLELSLSILSPEERNYAISKFQESVLNIVRILSLSLPDDIYNFAKKNDCNYSDDIFSLSIKTEILGNMESFTLAIKSK